MSVCVCVRGKRQETGSLQPIEWRNIDELIVVGLLAVVGSSLKMDAASDALHWDAHCGKYGVI